MSIELKFAGYADNWDRPVYKDKDSTKYVDVNLGENEPSIHTITPDWGEPNYPIKNFIIVKEFTL